MKRSFILPGVAIIMLLFATHHVLSRQTPTQQTQPPIAPAVSPFSQRIAAAGLVESRTENIAIGSYLPGIVEEVRVRVGQRVKPGELLFQLNTRQIDSEIHFREARLVSSQAELRRLEQMPRPEDVPPLKAQQAQAAARVAEMEDEFQRRERLVEKKAMSPADLVSSRERLAAARAEFQKADAELKRLMAGAWDADKAVSRAMITQMQAELEQQRTQRDRHRAVAPPVPMDAGTDLEVLQVNVRPGEAVEATSGKALVVLGEVRRKHVRVDVDEHDVPRFRPGAAATGMVRGDSHREYPLKFVRVEPFVTPKRNLTGDNTERVDTRVLPVIYEILEGADSVYVGQQMDVFIRTDRESANAAPAESSGAAQPSITSADRVDKSGRSDRRSSAGSVR
jgi:multidrug resistance efflux pump